jgi:hypothetical protein
MSTIVETKGSKTTRTITKSKPVRKKRKPVVLCGQSSNYQKPMKQGISFYEERFWYTTDGANKADTLKTRPLPKPCWKSFDKRRNQWKKEGYPSVRILNDTDKCIFPSVIV